MIKRLLLLGVLLVVGFTFIGAGRDYISGSGEHIFYNKIGFYEGADSGLETSDSAYFPILTSYAYDNDVKIRVIVGAPLAVAGDTTPASFGTAESCIVIFQSYLYDVATILNADTAAAIPCTAVYAASTLVDSLLGERVGIKVWIWDGADTVAAPNNNAGDSIYYRIKYEYLLK